MMAASHEGQGVSNILNLSISNSFRLMQLVLGYVENYRVGYKSALFVVAADDDKAAVMGQAPCSGS